MIKGDEQHILGDCAISPELDSQELAEIAVGGARSTLGFDMDPKVATLSSPAKGSAKSDNMTKVQEVVKLTQQKAEKEKLETIVDGELQFDATIVPGATEKKTSDAELRGDANVSAFPSLEASNIGYKVTQRLDGYDVVGPVLQGLNSPVSDSSHGCSTEDVCNPSPVTAAQALQ